MAKLVNNEQDAVDIGMQALVFLCHSASLQGGWWNDPDTGDSLLRNPYVQATKIALIHSEVSEMLEGHRRGKMDEHLPHRTAMECEMADAFIRMADLAGALGLDVGGAILEKMKYNSVRPDHKVDARKARGGKKY